MVHMGYKIFEKQTHYDIPQFFCWCLQTPHFPTDIKGFRLDSHRNGWNLLAIPHTFIYCPKPRSSSFGGILPCVEEASWVLMVMHSSSSDALLQPCSPRRKSSAFRSQLPPTLSTVCTLTLMSRSRSLWGFLANGRASSKTRPRGPSPSSMPQSSPLWSLAR